MKIVTWNVNSLRLREVLVLNWIEAEDPDVVCMQETKVTDQEFPEDSFGDLEYDVSFYGQPAYNGVAIGSREEQEGVTRGFPSDDDHSERRFLAATIDGVRFVDLYVPNGQTYASDKYAYKLEWLDALTGLLEAELAAHEQVVVCGDFNIAPRDTDAHDPHLLDEKSLFVSTEERAAFQKLLDLGLTDAFAHLHPDHDKPYTWWDYRGGSWERNRGLRIDHFLVTDAVLARARSVTIHRAMRGEEQPSDHVPVVLELA